VAADVLIIGAGPNGLATAAWLARGGRSVVVLEAGGRPGGLAAAEELAAGLRGPGLHHDTRGVRPAIAARLDLARHGLVWHESAPETWAFGAAGAALRLNDASAAGHADYRAFVERVRPAVLQLLDRPPLDPVSLATRGPAALAAAALRLRRLGRADLERLLRVPALAAADWLAEWFDDDLLRAALALPALRGLRVGPRAPSTAANLLLLDVAAGRAVAGGGPALVEALAAAATAAGAQIRTGAAVEQVLVGDAGVEGLCLTGGERLAARTVAASCDPRHLFLDLLPPGALAHGFERLVRQWRCSGTTGRVLLGLSRWPTFSAAGGARVERATVVDGIDSLEAAADVVKYGAFPEHPALEVHLAAGDAPGSCVVSALVHFVPREIRDGWNAASRERLGDRVVALLSRHAPDLAPAIVARDVLVPADIERRYGVTGGHVHHGEHALDQILVRPVPGCAGGRTPIPGLFLCGSGSAPGGGLTLAPAARAAEAIEGGPRREAARRESPA